jgi:hypothetical protein
MGRPQSRVQWTDRGPISTRKTITLLFHLAMVCIGTCCAYEWLVLGGRGIIFRAGGFLALFGLYLLWIDFLSPNRERI